MADIVSPDRRSELMSGIGARNTKPELVVRHTLFERGYRYRLHDKKLPGKPDLVLKKYNTVIFVHGCFWHVHDCHLFKWPSTRSDFWRNKLNGNKLRDKRHMEMLSDAGWRVAIVWECAIKGATRISLDALGGKLGSFLESQNQFLEITGTR